MYKATESGNDMTPDNVNGISKNSIADNTEYACSGCGACAAVCEIGAIALKLNQTGFFQAEIDEERCIHCGKCRSVCQRYDDEINGVSLYDTQLYALQSTDRNVLGNSASGGIAHELSRHAVCNGEKVSGVSYNYEKNIAEHIIIDSLSDLYKLDGSKYLQSAAAPSFRTIVRMAAEDEECRFVVFGLPCQIYGMRRAAERCGISKQLLLVELFCHGVPSYRLWEYELDHVERKVGTRHFQKMTFRDKNIDWHNYSITAKAGNRIYRGKRESDPFWHIFFEDFLLGESCYQCRCRKERSGADLRIGDYWGTKFQFNRDGVSAVYACTPKGQEAVRALIDGGTVRKLEATSAGEMLSRQNMQGYDDKEQLHAEVMEHLKSGMDVQSAVRYYRKKMPAGRKVKRVLLSAGSILPDRVRAGVKKGYSLFLMHIRK